MQEWDPCLARKTSDTSQTGQGVPLPRTQLSLKEPVGQEGPDSVAQVVIPALAPTLGKSLKADRSLCPVRALHYYLDRTSDLRQNKGLVLFFLQEKFWQSYIFCHYIIMDQADCDPMRWALWSQGLTVHQVKAQVGLLLFLSPSCQESP